MNWEAVFFDFDGVILDSVDVKTKAFAKMFRKYGPEVEKKVVEYHLANGGVSRFDKFRYYYENILKISVTEEQIQSLATRFSALVVDKVISSPFIPGALETLEYLKHNSMPAYIVSGTPDNEIKEIVIRKDLVGFFDELHGSPKKKWEITADIIARKRYHPGRCIFVGDAMSDYEAAQENHTLFIGIVPENSTSPFPENIIISNSIKTNLFETLEGD